MGRSQNWSVMARALREGHIATDEDRARIAELNRRKAERRAENKALKAERARRQPQIDARRTANKARDTSLINLRIGAALILSDYVATCQVGMLKQRLARDHGAYFSTKALPGQGVRFERIDPPHAQPAGNDPNGDLL